VFKLQWVIFPWYAIVLDEIIIITGSPSLLSSLIDLIHPSSSNPSAGNSEKLHDRRDTFLLWMGSASECLNGSVAAK